MRIRGKSRIYIGDHVTILNGARLEALAEWGGVNSSRMNGKLVIGDGTSIEQCCHLIAADELLIGKDCVLSAFVYISDCFHPYEPQENIMEQELVIRRTKVGRHCFIGIGSCIMPGVTVGDFCVIGANSVVTKDIPSYSMAAGVPAKVIKHYDQASGQWVR